MKFVNIDKLKSRLTHAKTHQGAISILFGLLALFWFIVFFKYSNIQKIDLYGSDCDDFSDSWYYLADGKHVYVELPTTSKTCIPADDDGYCRIYFDIPQAKIPDFYIGYFTKHQSAIVSIGNRVLESYVGTNYPKWFSIVGAYYHVVSIPQNSNTINQSLCIATKSTIKKSRFPLLNIEYTQGVFSEIKRGSRSSLLNYLVKRNIWKVVLSTLIFLLSLILLGIAYIFRRQMEGDHTLRALGYLTILVGCWLMEESFATQLLYSNPLVHWLFDYLFFLIMPITFYYFIEELSGIHNDRGLGILTYVNIFSILLQIGLQMTGVASIPQTIVITHLMLFASYIYIIYFFIRERKRKNSRLKGYFPAIVILVAGSLAELILFYFSGYETSLVIDLTFLVFFIFLGIHVYGMTVKKVQELADSATYQKLAYIDFSTGVYNRTAYYTYVEKFNSKKESYSVILFDMNNLKQINDHYGHLYGDKVIKTFSDCAQKSFGAYGKIYRIGGDEFLTLIHNPTERMVEEACVQFERNVAEQQEVQYKFTVAYGVAYFTAEESDDFFTAQKLADANMYKMKSMMKKEQMTAEFQKVTDCDAVAYEMQTGKKQEVKK